jgi:hypothetical protein
MCIGTTVFAAQAQRHNAPAIASQFFDKYKSRERRALPQLCPKHTQQLVQKLSSAFSRVNAFLFLPAN